MAGRADSAGRAHEGRSGQLRARDDGLGPVYGAVALAGGLALVVALVVLSVVLSVVYVIVCAAIA